MMDINCDMAEGLDNEEFIMPYIHSANVSCGLHAGNEAIIRRTISLAKKFAVTIGAHPSFDDRENFGRREMHLGPDEIYDLVFRQLKSITAIATEMDEPLRHVKPHGALYNMSAKDVNTARSIASAVKDFNPLLALVGLSGSLSIFEAGKLGLKTYEEGFADRRYNADGSLVSRGDQRALISAVDEAVRQVDQLRSGRVSTITGQVIPLHVDTICIHGDGPNAVSFARAIYESLPENERQK